jgi:glucose/arabinose dehydrogenase
MFHRASTVPARVFALVGSVLISSTAMAQAWKQGMTPEQATSTLAPLAGKLTVTPAADIPVGKFKVPAGFKVELWATGIPGGREIAEGDNGKFYVGTRGIGRVYEVTDKGNERTSRVVIDKLNQPSGVAYKDGTLFVASTDKVLRFDGISSKPDVAPVDVTAAFQLPAEHVHHNWKYLRFGPDGKLYMPVGAPCNICEVKAADFATIRRYNPDGSGMEVVATGVRNSHGLDWHPVTKELWFSNHGRDWMGDDTPNDTLNRMTKVGLNFGFPHCHQGNVADPDVKKDNACAGVEKPVALMGPHAAAMGVQFYTGSMFPAEYKNVAFVARKGSWNRTAKIGFDVVTVRSAADGQGAKIEPFMTGFLDPATQEFFGRPTFFHQMKDGSLLVSDEQVGAIYRISYAKP